MAKEIKKIKKIVLNARATGQPRESSESNATINQRATASEMPGHQPGAALTAKMPFTIKFGE